VDPRWSSPTSGCHEPRSVERRGVVKAPRIGYYTIPREELVTTASKPSADGVGGHVVPTHSDALGDSGQRQIDGRQPSTFSEPRSRRGAAVDLPAPLGPPSTTTAGEGSATPVVGF
jgi:hypothetical protein